MSGSCVSVASFPPTCVPEVDDDTSWIGRPPSAAAPRLVAPACHHRSSDNDVSPTPISFSANSGGPAAASRKNRNVDHFHCAFPSVSRSRGACGAERGGTQTNGDEGAEETKRRAEKERERSEEAGGGRRERKKEEEEEDVEENDGGDRGGGRTRGGSSSHSFTFKFLEAVGSPRAKQLASSPLAPLRAATRSRACCVYGDYRYR